MAELDGQKWRSEPTADSQEGKAKAVVEDAFRRADKNDDGSLSLEEFQTFFDDGILSTTELHELFREIDTHKTNNLDTSELCEYFAKSWGPFEKIFATLDDLGASISAAVSVTSQQYGGQTSTEKFATRFLLKEALTHMAHLRQPLDSATDALEEEALAGRSPVKHVTVAEANQTVTMPRWQQRLERSISKDASRWNEGEPSSLRGEVGRLAQLIDKLEGKVRLDSVEEEEVPQGQVNTYLVVSRDLKSVEQSSKDFQQSLKLYTDGTRNQTGCIHISVRTYAGTEHYTVYEVWENQQCLESHYASRVSRDFRRACVDQLTGPEDTKSILLPATWWPAR